MAYGVTSRMRFKPSQGGSVSKARLAKTDKCLRMKCFVFLADDSTGGYTVGDTISEDSGE